VRSEPRATEVCQKGQEPLAASSRLPRKRANGCESEVITVGRECAENRADYHGEYMRLRFGKFILAVTLPCAALLALPGLLRADGDAAKIYKKNCELCHGPDGSGNTPPGKAQGAKDLGSSEVQKKSDEELAEVITKGKNKMPAFGRKVKPEDIQRLVAYIRTLAKK
jgi:cytochrome c6